MCDRPCVEITSGPEDTFANTGDTAVLDCVASEGATFAWSKAGVPVQDEERIR